MHRLFRVLEKKREEKKASGAAYTKAEPNRMFTATPLVHPASAMNTEEGRAIVYGTQLARPREENLDKTTRPHHPSHLVRHTKECVASIEKQNGTHRVCLSCILALDGSTRGRNKKTRTVLAARMKKAAPGPQESV